MWKTWFFDGDRNLLDEVITLLKGYDFKKRFISHEKVNKKGEVKPHFHILCEMETVKPWNAMTAQLIRDFKLKEKTAEERKKRGQTGRGGYCAYGVCDKEVYDPETYTKYIAKDGDIWGDIPAEDLKKLIDDSRKKVDDRNWNEKILSDLEPKKLNLRFKNHDKDGYYYNDMILKKEILILYRKHGVVASKTKLENTFNYVSQMSKSNYIRMTDDELLEYFYRFN